MRIFLIVPKEGWFGQLKYSTQKTKNLRRICLCLYSTSSLV